MVYHVGMLTVPVDQCSTLKYPTAPPRDPILVIRKSVFLKRRHTSVDFIVYRCVNCTDYNPESEFCDY